MNKGGTTYVHLTRRQVYCVRFLVSACRRCSRATSSFGLLRTPPPLLSMPTGATGGATSASFVLQGPIE